MLQKLQRELATVQAQLTVANASMLDASASAIASFEIDTGEADQKVIFRRIDTLEKTIDILERKEEYLISRIGGTAVVSARVRRKP